MKNSTGSIQRIHPWPSDEGRANVVYGTFSSPRRLDGMAKFVNTVRRQPARFKWLVAAVAILAALLVGY